MADVDLDQVFRNERQRLWALSYRLTGSAAEADDLVQDSFVRAIERPAAGSALRDELVRIITTLSLEELRRRKAQAYSGDWLPAPIDTEDGIGLRPGVDAPPAAEPEVRYGLPESTSFPFLLALEGLDPIERTALILHGSLDYALGEVARLLERGAEDIRAAHRSARQSLETYDANRQFPTPDLRAKTQAALLRFVDCLSRRDTAGAEGVLSPRVRAVTDWGGTYSPQPSSTTGAAEVTRAHLQSTEQNEKAGLSTETRLVNGLPALLVQLSNPEENQAPRSVLRCDLDDEGRIAHLHSILAPAKLAGIRFARD